MIQVIDKLTPILILFALGHFLAKRHWFTDEAMKSLRKFVINVALSATLFKVFIEMDLQKEYFLIVILTIVLMALLFYVGKGIGKLPFVNQPLAGFVVTGFAFGTLGIPLFSIVFGVENLGAHSIFGIGHELFIWIFFINMMQINLGHKTMSWKFLISMFKSPMIIAVFSGLFLNMLGLSDLIRSGIGFAGIYTGITYVSQMVTPLILIIVGYNLRFEGHYIKQAAILVAIRFIVIGTIGTAFLLLVLKPLVGLTQMMVYGYIVFMLLPPPTSLALLIGQASHDDHQQHVANNAVVLYTIVSMVMFTVFVIIQSMR